MTDYMPCQDCGFWVKQNDTYCLNCHAIIPHNTEHLTLIARIIGIISFLFCLIRFTGDSFYKSNFLFNFFDLIPILAISLFVGWIGLVAGAITGGIVWKLKLMIFMRLRSSGNDISQTFSLKESEEIIKKRLSELQAYKQRVEETWLEVSKRKSTNDLQLSSQVLYSAIEVLQGEYKKYQVRLWQIEILRWQNSLEPMLLIQVLTYEDLQNHISNLQSKEKEGVFILKNWNEQKSLIAMSDGIDVTLHLKQILKILEKQIEKLLVKQTKLVVQSISPIEAAFSFPNTVIYQLDFPNSRHAIGEFSSDLNSLENEYLRLKHEDEAVKEVQALLSKV